MLLFGVSFSFGDKSVCLVGRFGKCKFANETFLFSEMRIEFRKDNKIALIDVSLE